MSHPVQPHRRDIGLAMLHVDMDECQGQHPARITTKPQDYFSQVPNQLSLDFRNISFWTLQEIISDEVVVLDWVRGVVDLDLELATMAIAI